MIFQIETDDDDLFYLLMLSCLPIVGLALFSIKFFIPSNATLVIRENTISIDGNEFSIEKISRVYVLKAGGLSGSYQYSLDFFLKDGITYPLHVFPFLFHNTECDIVFLKDYLASKHIVLEFQE